MAFVLQAIDAQTVAGLLYNNDQEKQNAANEVFTAINEVGDIG